MLEGHSRKVDVEVFVSRKNVIVGELDDAVEVVAAAFGAELYDVVRQGLFGILVSVMVPHAMHALGGGIAEAAHEMVVLGAIVELNVPAHGNEEHHKGHQKGAEL